MTSSVDTYFNRLNKWKAELFLLREIANESNLVEELKWNQPCYTYNGKNICILGGFKEFCCISFFKGSLLTDEENLLIQQGPNTKSDRIVKLTSVEEIHQHIKAILQLIYNAIEVEEKGIKAPTPKQNEQQIPVELEEAFASDSKFKTAFNQLTAGRQRGYLLFFTGAKQSKTVTNRILKHKERILKGFGINDCVCGLSKRMPNCDGSHKQLEKA